MRIKVYETPQILYGAAAETCAMSVRNHFRDNEGEPFRVCLGADKVNVEMMRELVTEDVNWRDVHVYFSWEFLGQQGTSAISRRKRITYNFTDKLTSFVAENLHFSDTEILDVNSADILSKKCKDRFDLIFVELLPNGGICMNIPPCNFDSRAAYINTKDFLDSECITVSPYKLLSSKRIVAIASGEMMANTVGAMFSNELSAMTPSTILKEHPDFILLLDKEAARFVPECYL